MRSNTSGGLGFAIQMLTTTGRILIIVLGAAAGAGVGVAVAGTTSAWFAPGIGLAAGVLLALIVTSWFRL